MPPRSSPDAAQTVQHAADAEQLPAKERNRRGKRWEI